MLLAADNILLNEYRPFTRTVTFFCVSALVFWLYRLWMNGKRFTDCVDGTGKVAIVTGANTSIGRETALGLARYRLQVIITCPNPVDGEQIRRMIVNKTGNDQIKYMQLDLQAFDNVQEFVDKFKASGQRLDYLVHMNTDISTTHKLNDERFRFTVGGHFYGQFLLSFLLQPILQTSKPSRILFTSSSFHGFYDNDFLRMIGGRDFCQSSVTTVLGARGLSNCLLNSGVTCNVVDPGYCFEDLDMMFGWLRFIPRSVKTQLNNLFLKSAKTRANAVLRMILDFNLQNISGTYYTNQCFSMPCALGLNDEVAQSIFRNIERVIKTKLAI